MSTRTDAAVPQTMKYVDLHRLLTKNGWAWVRTNGTHHIYRKGDRTERFALGGDQEIGGGGLKEIIKRFGLPYRLGDSAPGGVEGTRKPAAAPPVAPKAVAQPGTFGARLYEARTAAGISQGDLARQVGMTQAVISTWELGKINPFNPKGEVSFKATRPRIYAIAKMFGWADIMERSKPVGAADPPPQPVRVEPKTEEKPLIIPEKLSSDEKAFVKLLTASDVMQFIFNQEDKIRKLEKELARYVQADIGSLKRKAEAYDTLKTDTEALLKRLQETIER